ncbi:MAG: biopolymer transporter ExbD [Bryobacterales bacterium]|nr:biopolymer transporter ExbD [Bryobacterales bacterium]MDE0294867.1 biopolymer transporter ExbD [Bryobacterales bacterium]MDE0436775.1 biopolymer transporter ExbD [Bryobacterales bacterium]
MAFSNRNRQEESIADINITPFVDVVLVLLIIFMITAGVVEFGLEIDVPRTREVASTSEDYDFVNITSDGQLYLNTEPISVYDIAPRIKERQGEKGPGVYVRAHKETPWEVVAQVVAECGAGKVVVNMVTKPLERNPRRKR